MKILVLNCGSSSLKYKLMDMPKGSVLAQGGVEKIGMKGSFLKLTLPNGEKKIIERELGEHRKALEMVFEVMTGKEYGCISSLKEIDAVGHRVVHGGEKFNKSVIINEEVIGKVKECIDLAPLHNPSNLKGMEVVTELMGNIPQVAVFDTAFHQSMPPKAFLYGLPYELYEKYSVRRFGFHGTSHRYVSKRAAEIVGMDYENCKIISCHIGNGASIAAVKNGKSIDTSMGLTPLEGLIMGTRCGDIDGGAVTFLMEKENLDTKGISNLLNKKGGVLGLSGVSSDMREIDDAIAKGNQRAKTALDAYIYRIKKYIGSYVAALGGVDILLFTGGVGENQFALREEVCKGLECMGISVDPALNNGKRGEEVIISPKGAKAKVMVVPTDEEYMIASDTMSLLS